MPSLYPDVDLCIQLLLLGLSLRVNVKPEGRLFALTLREVGSGSSMNWE